MYVCLLCVCVRSCGSIEIILKYLSPREAKIFKRNEIEKASNLTMKTFILNDKSLTLSLLTVKFLLCKIFTK